MLDTKALAVQAGVGDLLCVVLRPVVEGYGQRDIRLIFVEEGDAVHPSREDDESVLLRHIVEVRGRSSGGSEQI